jgi:hypothetical protein
MDCNADVSGVFTVSMFKAKWLPKKRETSSEGRVVRDAAFNDEEDKIIFRPWRVPDSARLSFM